jgi:hypothetical protein
MKLILVFVLGTLTGGIAVGLLMHRENSNVVDSTPAARPVAVSGSPAPPDILTSTREPTANSIPQQTAATPLANITSGNASAAETGSYDFASTVNSSKRLDTIFASERSDSRWSTQTVDSLNMMIAGMAERALIGDYGLTCKESLCRLDIKGTMEQLASFDPKNNIQVALQRAIHEAPISDIFDDSTLEMGSEEGTGLATLTLYLHRRAPKKK